MIPTQKPLDSRLFHEFRSHLRVARARLLRTVVTTEEELATLGEREPGAPIEDAAREEVVGILARLGDQERRDIEEIDAAYAKLAVGTFGACEGCGGTIPLPRHRVMPAARHCVGCQATRE